jgi:gliding motility-associated-like protein
MKEGLRWGIWLFLLVGFIPVVSASHFMGGDVTYECLGNNEYLVNLTVYRDCNSNTAFLDNLNFEINEGDCGSLYTVFLPLSAGYPKTITPLCEFEEDACDVGEGIYGVQEFLYTDVIELLGDCEEIFIGFSDCCRNSAISTLAAPEQEPFYIGATVNTTLCNSSPKFNNSPTPFTCVGQQVNYNHGVTDDEGDDLIFSLVNCGSTSDIGVNYIFPYSGIYPLESTDLSIDPITGAISFIPTALQVGVLCVKVSEFRNGIQIGEIYRDIQFTVLDCIINSVDVNILPVLSGINGTANSFGTTGDFNIDLCLGEEFCFSLETYDEDQGNLELFWNESLEEGEFTISGNTTTNVTAEFCWTPGVNDIGSNFFTVTIMDDACDIRGINTYTFTLDVDNFDLDYTYEQEEPSCEGASDGTATLSLDNSLASPTVTWQTSPPQIGLFAENLTAGSYDVVIESPSFDCGSIIIEVLIDNRNVLVVFEGSISSDVSCNGFNNGILDIDISGGIAPYDILWSNGSSDTILYDLEPGAYTVSVTDGLGCEEIGIFNITEPLPITINYSQSDYNSYGISCFSGADGSIDVTLSGGSPPLDFEWSTGTIEEGLENLTAGTYAITITDAIGCQDSLEIILTEPEPLELELDNIPPSCFYENDGSIVIEGITGGVLPYGWSLIDGGNFIPIDTFPVIVPNQTRGEKIIYFNDGVGCTHIYTVEVEAPDSLYIDIIPQDTVLELGESVDISFLTNSADSFDFVWTSTETIECETCPSFNYQPLSYTELYLNITEKTNDCTAEGIAKIRVREEDYIFVPNVFSPNNDGNNDLLSVYAKSNAIQSISSFHVFNRWGEEVYQLNNFQPNTLGRGWDGNIFGKSAPVGVYIYTLEALYINGKRRRVSGEVTLVR